MSNWNPFRVLRCQDPDVTINVGTGAHQTGFLCYRVFLCLSCDYFDDLFTRDKQCDRIEFPDMDPKGWELFYEYVHPNSGGNPEMGTWQNPKGQLKGPSTSISSHDDSGKSDDKKFDINHGSATHLSNMIVQGAYQTTKTKLIAFTIIMASAFMVPTVVITKKVSLSSDLKSTIQRIVREFLGDTGTFADNNIFCITKKDKSLNNYKCMEEGFCPKAISWEGAVMVIGGSDNQVGKVREMIEYIKLEHYCLLVLDDYDIIACQGTNITASGELYEFVKLQHLGVIGITSVPVPSLILKSKIL